MTTSPFINTSFSEFSTKVISSLPIRKKTRATYESVLRRHINPVIGSHELSKIEREDIQHTIAKLPPQIAATTLAVVKTVYREALLRNLLESSPAHGIATPKIMVAPKRFLTWETLNATHFGKYNTQIKFLALHGLRWSEALALTQDDIRDGRIFITKSVHGQTKSRAGIRMVPLVSEFKPLPKSPKTLNLALKPYQVTIHSLRHSYAYILKQQGVHVTTAQRLLGHSDPRVTMAVYTQVLDNEIDAVGVLLSKIANPNQN
jgi:integrase